MAYSQDMRKAAVRFYGECKNYRKVAKTFGISTTAVRDWVERYEATGNLDVDYSKSGRRSKLDNEAIQVLLKLVEEDCSATEVELARLLNERTGLSVSSATIGYQLRKRGLTYKKRLSEPRNSMETNAKPNTSSSRSEPNTSSR